MANVALEVAAAACVCVWHFLVAPAAAFQSFCVCVCACGSVHILDRKKFFSCGTSSIFHHFAPVGMAPCVFWIVMSLFCRLHFQSSCVSAFIILRERIVVFSCSPLRFLPLCVCVSL